MRCNYEVAIYGCNRANKRGFVRQHSIIFGGSWSYSKDSLRCQQCHFSAKHRDVEYIVDYWVASGSILRLAN